MGNQTTLTGMLHDCLEVLCLTLSNKDFFFIIFLLDKLGQEEDGNMRVHIGKIGGLNRGR